MLENMWRAAKLDKDFYNTVEADASFTVQAFVVVVLVGAALGIGEALSFRGSGLFGSIAGSIVGVVVGWIVWAALTAWVGTRIFRGTTDVGEMLRVLGFASAPLVLGLIPFLGLVGAVWALVAAVVAIREGLDFDTGRAIGTLILGWIGWVVVTFVLGRIFGAIF